MKKIWVLICILVSGAIVMAQVSVQEAKTNFQSWLNLIGLNPEWSQYQDIDFIVTVLGVCIIVISFLVFLFIVTRKKESPLEIQFKDVYVKSKELNKIKFYWCYIHNKSNKDIENVTVDLVYNKIPHRLAFHNGGAVTEIAAGNQETVDLISYNRDSLTEKQIHVINTNANIDIDFGCDYKFTVKVCAKGQPPTDRDFKFSVTEIINFSPILKMIAI